MFGIVTANLSELSQEQLARYNAVYCGICRNLRGEASNLSRLTLSYDMAFLALLHMSLYEPEETGGERACALHPVKPKAYVDCDAVRYAADMNLALSYYNCLDDWQDDHNLGAKVMAGSLDKHIPKIGERYPRQYQAISDCLNNLAQMEKAGCANPDEPAGCFGSLMAELMVWKEDLWAPTLRQMGFFLGRFVYLADAAADYRQDKRRKKYNPFLAMGTGDDRTRWEEYLVLSMAECTQAYERLPLVQDKGLLDNILYSGVWAGYRGKLTGKKDKQERSDGPGEEQHG